MLGYDLLMAVLPPGAELLNLGKKRDTEKDVSEFDAGVAVKLSWGRC